MAILQWQPNEPTEVQLKFPTGKHSQNRFGSEQVMFTLSDGRVMYVPLIVEKQLLALQVRPGQPVEICKHQAQGKTEWKVKRIERKPEAKPVARAQSNGHAQPAAELLNSAADLTGPDIESAAERNLELALRISIAAAKKAEDYGQKIGKPVQFDTQDIRAMANTMLMNGRGRAA